MGTTFLPDELFALADQIERRGRQFYERMSRLAPTPRSRQLFDRLAREEAEHGGEFERITREALALSFEIPDGYASPELLAYLEALREGRGLPEVAAVTGAAAPDERELFRLAVAYEKDAILLLHEIYDVLPPSIAARRAVGELIRAEKGQFARICGLLSGKLP
ncbi:MAG TPA: ferritin family protein [Candidatus Ozemobacteraceae bacterium]|nr:ferritin family protein [Candidatus Ozemobacteraceae bacterium]